MFRDNFTYLLIFYIDIFINQIRYNIINDYIKLKLKYKNNKIKSEKKSLQKKNQNF